MAPIFVSPLRMRMARVPKAYGEPSFATRSGHNCRKSSVRAADNTFARCIQEPGYELMETVKQQGYRTVLSIPMLREGNLRGVITILKTNVEPFTPKQIELIETFADQAMIAIENVRLFESVQTRTRELAKSLEDLRTAQDRLVQTEKLASLGQLTAGIAHEIKNPLNFVNNFSGVSVELIDELQQTLTGANLDKKLRAEITEIADMLQSNLDKVVHHGKRADAIVKNMLLHSRRAPESVGS